MLPDLSVFWVIFFVLVLTIVLDRLLFKPVQRVMAQREAAIRSARELAEQSAARAKTAAAEFAEKTGAARAEIYKQMDEMRREALNARAKILADTRAEAEAEIASAGAKLQASVDEARQRLAADAEVLGAAAAERVLAARPPSLTDSRADQPKDAIRLQQSGSPSASTRAPCADPARLFCCGGAPRLAADPPGCGPVMAATGTGSH